MKITLPKTRHPIIKVTATAGTWTSTRALDRSHRTCEVTIPQGVDEAEVTVMAQFCNVRGQPVEEPSVVLKEATKKERPKPEPRTKVKPKMEPAVEPSMTPMPTDESTVNPKPASTEESVQPEVVVGRPPQKEDPTVIA